MRELATIGEWLRDAAATLERAGRPSAARDAAVILATALGDDVERTESRAAEELPPELAAELAERVARRARGERLAYVIGRVRFRGLELHVDERVYLPRSDVMVDVACKLPAGARLHEVGTGCGAISLAIKRARRDLAVSASDVSADAVDVARANAARLGLEVRFLVADAVPPGEFDLVIANMPYVLPDDPLVDTEFAGEPRVAVVCESGDRLELIRHVIASAPLGTRLALQHATADAGRVAALLDNASTERLPGGPAVTWGVARGAERPVAPSPTAA